MRTPSQASLLLVAAFACAFLGSAGASRARPPVGPDSITFPSPSIAALVNELEEWLDRESRYKRRSIPMTVRFAGTETMKSAASMPGVQGFALRGYYHPPTATIYLLGSWSPDNPYDVSVLLHELVHHRQQSLTHWECPGAQERPAYRLQERWLAERGLEAPFNWFVVRILSRCRTGPFEEDSTEDRH